MSVFDSQQRAVKQYFVKLPKELKARYGGSGKSGYTSAQVQTTVTDLKLSTKYVGFAILIFCGEQALQAEGATSEELLKMTQFLGKIGSGGSDYASDGGVGGSFADGFDGGCGDGGGGGD